MPIDDQLHRATSTSSEAAPGVGPAPGRATPTSRLSPSADAVAQRVLRLMRKAERDDNGVAAGADAAVARASSSSGAPLPDSVRGQFEGSLGADLCGVRVHTGGDSAAAADAVGARAYTTGNDIHFNAGQYAPSDPFGLHLLAHETAHTVQQSSGAQRVQAKLEVSSPGDAAELEADRAADAMVAGRATSIAGASSQVVRSKIFRDAPQGEGGRIITTDDDHDAGIIVGDYYGALFEKRAEGVNKIRDLLAIERKPPENILGTLVESLAFMALGAVGGMLVGKVFSKLKLDHVESASTQGLIDAAARKQKMDEIAGKIGDALKEKTHASFESKGKAKIAEAGADKKKLAISFFSAQQETLTDMKLAAKVAFSNHRAEIVATGGVDALEQLAHAIEAEKANAVEMQMEATARQWAVALAQSARGTADGGTDMSHSSKSNSGVVQVAIANYYRKSDTRGRLPVASVSMAGVNPEGQAYLRGPIKQLGVPILVYFLVDGDPGAQIGHNEAGETWTGPRVPSWWLEEWGGGEGVIEQVGSHTL